MVHQIVYLTSFMINTFLTPFVETWIQSERTYTHFISQKAQKYTKMRAKITMT